MTTSERYYLIAYQRSDAPLPEEEGAALYNRIEAAVTDYDERRARSHQSVRLFRLEPIDDDALYDWGVSSDAAAPGVLEYVNERAARNTVVGLTAGHLWRRRIGSDTWEEVATRD